MRDVVQQLVLLTAAVACTSCGPVRSSMIDYAGLQSTYRAEFFVHDQTVAVRVSSPPGLALILWEPHVEAGGLVFNAGIASTGSGGEHTSCFRLDRATLPAGWAERLYWRETGGDRVRITAVHHDEEARGVVATRCSRAGVGGRVVEAGERLGAR